MHWFVVSPINGLESFPDDTEGQKKVLDFVEYEISYYEDRGLAPRDFLIFRGEKHTYVPPSKEGALVKAS